MTNNSIICNYMNTHKDTWREDIAAMSISIKEDEDTKYALFMYAITSKLSDPLVQEARGIIIDTEKCEVVCWPFRKFGKHFETYADKIDWSTARVQEKLDGSIIKLWYSYKKNEWIWSTNSMIYAKDASVDSNGTDITFDMIIKSSSNYSMVEDLINNNELNKDYTYIFELTGPLNRVVIKYNTTTLYHIGTRNNITGEELIVNIDGLPHPKEFDIKSLEDAIKLVDDMNTEQGKVRQCVSEGFVVVDDKFNRIKVKSSVYTVLHNIESSTKRSKITLLQMLYYDNVDISSLVNNYDKVAPELKYYDYKLTELIYNLTEFVSKVRLIYKNTNYDRKVTAEIIKDHKLSYFGFKALDNNNTVHQMLANTSHGVIGSLESLIPDYDRTSWL